jgi:protein phosphatase
VIPAPAPHLTAVVETHPGETGKSNEDRYGLTSYVLGPDNTPVVLAVVADGIGGHLAGEVAAQIAVDTFVALMATFEGGDPVEHMRQAIIEAGGAIAQAAQESPEQEGMGSTLSAVLVIGQRLYAATIGDSRIYLRRGGRLIQTSIDHTWVQEAIEHKIIPAEAARNHPHAHVLRRHLGSRLEPKPDFRLRLAASESDEQAEANQGLLLQPGDQVLICTDGLTDLVRDYEIAGALRRRAPEAAVHYLVGLARSRGGFDNITTLLLTVPGRTSGRGCGARARFLIAAAISALLLIVFVLAAVAGAWWFRIGPFQLATTTATSTPTVTHSATVEPSATPAPTSTPTLTPTLTATPTPEPSATSSATSEGTASAATAPAGTEAPSQTPPA